MMLMVTVISSRISELAYLDIKEKGRKEKRKQIFKSLYSKMTACLKVNPGVLLALGYKPLQKRK